jgi:ribosomal-protein-alanine N-acetyltransferase
MLGFGIMKYDDDVAHLLLFAVREDARRQGVGSALLAWLEQVALVAGVRRFVVEARTRQTPARELLPAARLS